jgi:hypothetical protein
MKRSQSLQFFCAATILLGACFSKAQSREPDQEQFSEDEDVIQMPMAARIAPRTFSLKSEVAKWKAILPANDPYVKLVDNHGDGNESLYGTRNFRAVLHGVYYRGGANNVYNKNGKRANQNPLPDEGLRNLCEVGFSEAIYYYSTNFNTAPANTLCRQTTSGTDNNLKYIQKTALTSTNQVPVLTEIFKRIKGQIAAPIYGHCWNGWHASGLMASLALRQFCHWTGAEAVSYWRKNTDGNSSGYSSIENKITSFKPVAALEITDSERALICPQK